MGWMMVDPGNVPKWVSTDEPRFTIPRTNDLLRELVDRQERLSRMQERDAEKQRRAAIREWFILAVAVLTLLVTAAGVFVW